MTSCPAPCREAHPRPIRLAKFHTDVPCRLQELSPSPLPVPSASRPCTAGSDSRVSLHWAADNSVCGSRGPSPPPRRGVTGSVSRDTGTRRSRDRVKRRELQLPAPAMSGVGAAIAGSVQQNYIRWYRAGRAESAIRVLIHSYGKQATLFMGTRAM